LQLVAALKRPKMVSHSSTKIKEFRADQVGLIPADINTFKMPLMIREKILIDNYTLFRAFLI